MEQSVITDTTLGALKASAEKVLGRELEQMEYAVMEFAVNQIRLGVAELGADK